MRRHPTFFSILLFFALFPHLTLLQAAEPGAALPIELLPIVKAGTPGDALMQNAVSPAQAGATQLGTGSGSLQKSLSDQIAVPVTGIGAPGNVSQFRGLGRSAEDTDVQALGIPLNPPQGGGFDLSVFPQFLWSSYEYQVGPALGTFDPRGTAGSLTLLPWTAQALSRRSGADGSAGTGRVLALGSTATFYQVSAAGSDGHHLAAVVGNTSGDAQGPSAAFSAKGELSAGQTLAFHLLLTDVDAKIPGPQGITPFAHQRTVRAIPLLQLDLPIGHGEGGGLLKSSVFFDGSYLRYEDPSASSLPQTQDHIFQAGTENALLLGAWRFGAGLRGTRYQTLGFADQSEAIVNLLASRAFEFGAEAGWLMEPSVRAVGVTSYGLLPEGSLGLRRQSGEQAWFARVGVARHFPSLLNRFYNYPGFPGYSGFVGNPGLQPERDWTATTGVESGGRLWHLGVEIYGQFAEDAQVRAALDAKTDTTLNLGNARILSLLVTLRGEPASWLSLGESVTLSGSQISQVGQAFPGLPGFLNVASAAVHAPGDRGGDGSGGHVWEARLYERTSSVAAADASGNLLPAFHEEDVEVQARIGKEWFALARFDDLLDQRPQYVVGYPGLGRVFSLLLQKRCLTPF